MHRSVFSIGPILHWTAISFGHSPSVSAACRARSGYRPALLSYLPDAPALDYPPRIWHGSGNKGASGCFSSLLLLAPAAPLLPGPETTKYIYTFFPTPATLHTDI